MIYKIIFSIVFFIWFLHFNYKGALGRIEGINQKTVMPQDLGPVKPHEQKIYFMIHNIIIVQEYVIKTKKTLENQMINKGLSTRYGTVFEPDIISIYKNVTSR